LAAAIRPSSGGFPHEPVRVGEGCGARDDDWCDPEPSAALASPEFYGLLVADRSWSATRAGTTILRMVIPISSWWLAPVLRADVYGRARRIG